MKLAIICGGEVFTVTNDLDDYDLSQNMPRTLICDMIQAEKKRIRKYENCYKREVKDGE